MHEPPKVTSDFTSDTWARISFTVNKNAHSAPDQTV